MSIHGFPMMFLDRLNEEEEEEDETTRKRKRDNKNNNNNNTTTTTITTRARRKKKEEEEEETSPMYAFLNGYADIVERFVFSKLDGTSLRLLSRANKEMKRAVENARVWTAKNRTDRKFSTQLRARDIQTRELLRYACEKDELKRCHRLVGFFAAKGNLECVRYLLEELFRFTWGKQDKKNAYGTIAAAQEGHFKVLKYLVEEGGCHLSERVCSEASGIGSLKMLRYCRNHFAPWNHRCIERAALNGHTDIVKFLLKHRAPIRSANPAIFAAEGGHLNLVKMFYDFGVVFDERVAEQAAEMGHLEILKFVVEKELPWHPHSCMQACSRPSEYVRDEYYEEIEVIKERHAGCRAFILSIFPMMLVEDGINDIDEDDDSDSDDGEEDDE